MAAKCADWHPAGRAIASVAKERNAPPNRPTTRLWLLAAWANGLGIDYVSAYEAVPDLAGKVRSNAAKKAVQQYLESQDAVPVMNTLQGLAKSVLKLSRADRLAADKKLVEKQLCALALASCIPGGREFAV